MSDPKMPTEELILYLLNQIQPEQSTKIRLNKLAFFIEFGYMYKCQKELSDAKYAAINYGPIIDDYKNILAKMASEKKITLDGNHVRPLISPTIVLSAKTKEVVD